MELTLGRDDLDQKHKDIPCSGTKFKHFKRSVQDVIRLVGKGRFITYIAGYENYNVIYPQAKLQSRPSRWVEAIPKDFPVQPLKVVEKAIERATCGHCGLSWDDGKITSMTPTPSARCPFEAFHIYDE